jgi:cellulase
MGETGYTDLFCVDYLTDSVWKQVINTVSHLLLYSLQSATHNPFKMAPILSTLSLALTGLPLLSLAQQIGTPESRPLLTTWRCTARNGCSKQSTSVVLDAATHSIHALDDPSTSCTTSSGSLDSTLCPDKETCASNCVIDGITDYAAHGVETNGGVLKLTQYKNVNGTLNAVSPRVYLLSESNQTTSTETGTEEYTAPSLLNQEFTFTVDVSALPCGMNGALYLSEMSHTGGRSAELNPAGASYGTGYCDAQCYVTPWINGAANVAENGACCNEMDIWEANSRATGLTPHPCNYNGGTGSTEEGVYECIDDEECNGPTGENDSVCDKWGCGFNPYALGAKDYYGRGSTGFEVDTTAPFTVVTQFRTADNTTTGALAEIRRLYIQGGKVIQNAVVTAGGASVNSLTDSLCDTTSSWYAGFGGMERMGEALGRGMVLAMSIWNDAGEYMQWLDGEDSGPCNATEGAPAFIEANTPGTSVTFSNLRWGDIGSTFRGTE